MIYEIFNLIIEVSVISTIIVLLMGDSKKPSLGEKYGYFSTTSNYFSNPACINQKIQTSSLEKNRS
jgi:hypothetical protein